MESYKEYVGNKYNYQGKNIFINEIKIVQGKYVIKTDIRTFVFHEFDIDSFTLELKPYKEKKQFKMSQQETTIEKTSYLNNDNDEIKNVLFDAINKVKEDANYVKQANAICNITSQLIAIKKIELLNK